MLNIADYMRLRLQNDFSTLNRALDFSVHNDSLRSDSSGDMSLGRDKERTTAHFAIDLPIDLY